MRMKAERIIDDREAIGAAYEECVAELKERLWEEEWRDAIDVPNRASLEKTENGQIRIVVELCQG